MEMGRSGNWRKRAEVFFSSRRWESFIITIIVLNAITLGLETSPTAMAMAGSWLTVIDRIILGIFVLEISARLIVFGKRFWRDPWSLFDFSVVAIALVPATGEFSVLRALRIIRVLRLISTVESMRRVVSGLLRAIPGMGSIISLLALLFYVFSVMATKLYGADFPHFFGSIPASAFTLFQIMTLEGWAAEIVRPVMAVHPYAWIFFIIFILVTSFAVLNLFIGIIVDSMQMVQEEDRQKEQKWTAAEFDLVLAELRALREEVQTLREEKESKRY